MLDHNDVTDGKRTEQIKLLVPERMALDLLRASSFADRSISDFIYQVLRRELYGHLAALDRAGAKPNRDD